MLNSLLLIIIVAGYCLSSLLILTGIRQANNKPQLVNWAFAPAAIAALIHLYCALAHVYPLNFSLSAMSLLFSACLIGLFLIACLFMPIRRLGVLVFPVAALSLIFAVIWNSAGQYMNNQGVLFDSHILVSIIAFSMLAIASLQAILFYVHERQIKNHSKSVLLLALPPLQTMEKLLFRLVGLGFILLTLTLFSGMLFSQQIFGHAFQLKHHTILAIMGWCMFAYLLYQHKKNGLRGAQAVIWTVGGFFLIQLGYFGTKLVTESLALQ